MLEKLDTLGLAGFYFFSLILSLSSYPFFFFFFQKSENFAGSGHPESG